MSIFTWQGNKFVKLRTGQEDTALLSSRGIFRVLQCGQQHSCALSSGKAKQGGLVVVRLAALLEWRNENISVTNISASCGFTQTFQVAVRFKARDTHIYAMWCWIGKEGRKEASSCCARHCSMAYLQQHHGITDQWMEKFSTILVNELAKVSILDRCQEKKYKPLLPLARSGTVPRAIQFIPFICCKLLPHFCWFQHCNISQHFFFPLFPPSFAFGFETVHWKESWHELE